MQGGLQVACCYFFTSCFVTPEAALFQKNYLTVMWKHPCFTSYFT